MNRMIISNLAYRPLRSIISVFAVAIEVTLILLIVGLVLGILEDSKDRQKGIGADVMVRATGAGAFSALSSAPMPIAYSDVIRKQPHVAAVAPVIMQTTSSVTSIEILNGINLDTFQQLGGPFRYLAGGPFQNPYDMIVDDIYAPANKVKVGSTVTVLNHDFRVCGIVPHGRGSRRYVPMKTLQDLMDAQGKASAFYVKADDPKNVDLLVQELKTLFPNNSIMSIREWMEMMTTDNIPGLAPFIRVAIGIAVIIGFIVIFQSMYTAVMERTREIGILKSLGASKLYIVRVILRETLMLAVAGILVGYAFSAFGRAEMVRQFPTLRVLPITPQWALYSALIAIGGAMLGALYPAFKAAQKDPIDALAYE